MTIDESKVITTKPIIIKEGLTNFNPMIFVILILAIIIYNLS